LAPLPLRGADAGSQRLAVRGKSQGVDVPRRRIEHADVLGAGQVPEVNFRGRWPGEQVAVRGKGKWTGDAGEGSQELPRFNIPEPQDVIEAGGGEELAVRREAD